MKRLIVNADDLGLTEGVSSGILHAHHYGMVTVGLQGRIACRRRQYGISTFRRR